MTRAYKALFVDQNGDAWSMMKNRAGFAPLLYPRNGSPVIASDKYLFAFDTLPSAVSCVIQEFAGRIEGGTILPSPDTLGEAPTGHFEIWSADVEKLNLPTVNILAPEILNDADKFYDAFLRLHVPAGTLFCASIALVRQVTQLV